MSDIRDAARLLAQREANAAAGPCPHCGGQVEVDLIDVTSFFQLVPSFVPGGNRTCVDRCWEDDPEGYLNSAAPGWAS